MNKKDTHEKKNISVVNIGTSSMVVILVGLCFTVLTALTVSSARNDYVLSKRLADHTFNYYQALGNVQAKIAADHILDDNLAVQIEDELWLCVDVEDGKIVNCFEINNSDWEADNRLPLFMD